MIIAITGAKGQVGTELVKLAVLRGHQVLALGSAELDITNGSQVSDVLAEARPGVVINAAAYTAVDKAESEPELARAVNVAGARNLAEACRNLDIPLLHISTDYVFNGEKQGEYLEQDSTAPTSVYGQTKLDGELAIADVLSRHIILRVSWVFGATGNNFVKTMLRLGATRDELGVVDDQYGAPTSATSIARVLLDICSHPDFGREGFAWGMYHLASTPGVTWHGFAKEIFAQAKSLGLLNKDMKVNAITSDQFPTPVKRPANSKLGSDKLNKLVGHAECDWKSDLLVMLKVLKSEQGTY